MSQETDATISAVLAPVAKAAALAVENYAKLAEQIYWRGRTGKWDLSIPENVLQTSISLYAKDVGEGAYRLRHEVPYFELFEGGHSAALKADAVIYSGIKAPRSPLAIIEFKSDSRRISDDMNKLVVASRSGLKHCAKSVFLVCAGICYSELPSVTINRARNRLIEIFEFDHIAEEGCSSYLDSKKYYACAVGVEVACDKLVRNAIYFATSPLSLPPPKELT